MTIATQQAAPKDRAEITDEMCLVEVVEIVSGRLSWAGYVQDGEPTRREMQAIRKAARDLEIALNRVFDRIGL